MCKMFECEYVDNDNRKCKISGKYCEVSYTCLAKDDCVHCGNKECQINRK